MSLAEVLVFLLFILLIVCLFLLFKVMLEVKEWRDKFDIRVKEWLEKEAKTIREDAIKRSALVRSGKILEKLVPFLADFKYDPHDVRWLGDPIDLVIFDGYTRNRKTAEELQRIVFVEVKSGESSLTKAQKKIRQLIEDGKVGWDEFRI